MCSMDPQLYPRFVFCQNWVQTQDLFKNVPLLLSFSDGCEEYDGKTHPAEQIDLLSLKLMLKTCDFVL